MRYQKALIAAAAALAAASAHAGITTYTGNTAGAASFNRPLEDFSGLSGIGTAVRYDRVAITVSVSGMYSFVTTGLFDTFTLLYSTSFNAASPLANGLVANDDTVAGALTVSGFAEMLTAGSTYFHVVTGFSNADAGAFTTTIGGPGLITVVPEASTYAMMCLGLLAVSGVARRRRG